VPVESERAIFAFRGSRAKDPLMISLVLSSCLLWGRIDPPRPGSDPPGPSAAEIIASIERVMSDAIAKAEPSVVAIARVKGDNPQETQAVRGRRRPLDVHEPGRPLLFPRARPPSIEQFNLISFDFGSGVVIGNRGEILTLFHVVRGARRLIVRAAGRQEFDAEIIAADPRSDLAVIVPVRGEGEDPPRLKPMPIGDAARLRKGTFLIALGNSFNAARDGSPSASWGILSNIARKIEGDTEDNSPRRQVQLANYPTLLQLDTKLNLGMSGGAVINLQGELVGLTTTAASPVGFDTMAGYAVPMDKLGRRAVEALKDGREVEYGLLGIRADQGATNRVFEVTPHSPAALGELKVDDEIRAVNDVPVVDFETLIVAVNVYAPGDSIRLKIRRGEETFELPIVLAKLPVDGEIIATNRPKPWRGLRVDYATAHLFRSFGPNLPDSSGAGVVVADVEEGSPASVAGMKKGQLIRKVDGKSVRTPIDFNVIAEPLEGPVLLDTDLGKVTVK
jgi:S1-C subfamily serine protease